MRTTTATLVLACYAGLLDTQAPAPGQLPRLSGANFVAARYRMGGTASLFAASRMGSTPRGSRGLATRQRRADLGVVPPSIAQPLMALSFAIPCFTMGFRMLSVWRDPMAIEQGRWVRLGVGVFVMEFILLHAGIMIGAQAMDMSSGALSIGGAGLLVGFYTLFAGAFAFAFKSRMLFMSFVWVIVGRFVAVLIGVSNQDKALFLAHSVIAMMIYFALVIASVFLPWPRLGITEAIATQTRDPKASGLWVEQPHRAIGPATVYFLVLGIVEIALMTWVDPSRISPR